MPNMLTTPQVVPATPEKTFPVAWYSSVGITIVPGSPGRATIIERAMAEDGSIHPTYQRAIECDDLASAMASVPAVGAAVNAIVAAVPALETWLASRFTPPAP